MVSTNIISSLGMGSGIDIKQLVSDLSAASREPKVDRINTMAAKNSAKISAVAVATSRLNNFADSLAQMITDGSLRSQATSSDDSAVGVTSRAGLSADRFNATIIVNQLARAQTSYSAIVADKTAAIGEGTMTLSMGGQNVAITIDSSNNSLEGLAAAINNSGSGVSASLIADDGGFRLVLKGQNGQANSFTLTADAGADANLSNFTYGDGGSMTLGQSAANAEFTVDGVAFSRGSNTVDDILSGMSLSLKKVTGGQPVDIGASRPVDLLRQTIGDFVDVYNQLRSSLETAAKETGSASSLRQLESELNSLLSKTLTSHPSINKLSDLGISSSKTGGLVIDYTKLDGLLANNSAAVEAIFNPRRDETHSSITDIGISDALDAIRDKAVASDGVLGRISSMLESRQKALQEEMDKVETREAAYKARLEKQYNGLEAKLAAYEATRSYLDQQIEMWNNMYKG
jgi:flagellar hook-associated protein 2